MKAVNFFILLLCVILSNCEDAPDICSLSQGNLPLQNMYCSCDSELFNKANKITCYIFGDFKSTDVVWKGFERQQKIHFLTLNSRPQNPLSFLPVDVLKVTTELRGLTIGSAELGNLNPYSISRMNYLETVDLASNNITGMTSHAFAYLPNLTKLTLSENEISTISENSFYELPELRRLYLDQNKITMIEDLAFLHLPNVQEIDLFQNEINRITSKTFVGLKSLHRLDLSRNRLTRIDDEVFMPMPQLRELDLSMNTISEVSSGAFQGLSHMRSLRLSQNRITTLPGGVFLGASDLMAIDLANNKINSLNENVMDGLSHRKNPQFTFQLKKNPLVCVCELQWLAKFTLEHETSKLFVADIKPQYIKCQVKDFIVDNWTKGDFLSITALVDVKCPKTTTPQPSTVTSTTTTTLSPVPTTRNEPVPEKHLYFEESSNEKKSEKMKPQEIEMSDAIVEDVTKSMADQSKSEKRSKNNSSGSAKVKFESSTYVYVLFSLLIVTVGSSLRC